MAGKNSVFTDYSAPAVDATWLNIIQTEENNVITTSGQPLSDSTLDQQAISIASYAAQGSVFCTDSGSANAYVLTQVSPFKAPYALKNGLTVRFRAGNNNTTTSTANAFGLGAKTIKQGDGSTNIASGMITTGADVTLRYNLSLDVWILGGTAAQYNVGTTSGTVPLIGTQSATTSLAGLTALADNSTTQTGTSTTTATTPAGLAATCLGLGQTWQDVTASRAIGTTYTNSTGRPIQVIVRVVNSSGSSTITFTSLAVGGVNVSRTQANTDGVYTYEISAIVPNGATYLVSGGSMTLGAWIELR